MDTAAPLPLGWSIRLCTHDDFDIIARLLARATRRGGGTWLWRRNLSPQTAERLFHQLFLAELESGRFDALLLERAGQLLGHLTWTEETSLPDREGSLRIVDSMATAGWEGRGVTCALVQHFLSATIDPTMPAIGDVTLRNRKDWETAKQLCASGWCAYGAVIDPTSIVKDVGRAGKLADPESPEGLDSGPSRPRQG